MLNELQTGLNIPEKVRAELSVICDKDKNKNKNKARLGELFDILTDWCGLADKVYLNYEMEIFAVIQIIYLRFNRSFGPE